MILYHFIFFLSPGICCNTTRAASDFSKNETLPTESINKDHTFQADQVSPYIDHLNYLWLVSYVCLVQILFLV